MIIKAYKCNLSYITYTMNLLIVDSFHHKNQQGLGMIVNALNLKYRYGNINDIGNPDYDIIYSPNNPVDTSRYPSKRFIFGPHFSVFPDSKLTRINNVHKNSVYIQPSDWVRDLWSPANAVLPVKTFPFPVDTERFAPLKERERENEKREVFIYFKRRNPQELQYLKDFLTARNIAFKVFDYVNRYSEQDYIEILQRAKYGIVLDAHESQGFAIEEALACDVPLLVWNVRLLSQEHGSRYPDAPATSIAYWDARCGEHFYEQDELESVYNKFISNLATYKPREYILENLSVARCAERFTELVNSYIK